jgi:chromosome segregation ATPase
MPEIVSSERILAKLKQFDDRLSDAISASESILELRDNAAELLMVIDADQEEIAAFRLELSQIHEEWQELVEDLTETQEHTEEARKTLRGDFEQACAAIEKRFDEIRLEVEKENIQYQIEHSHLVEESRNHAEEAAANSHRVEGLVSQTKQLLSRIQEELHVTIQEKLTQLDVLIDARFNTIENEQKSQINSLKLGLEEKIISFRQEVKKDIAAHQQGVDRQITEFLGKQNILIQNLTQQIDGFQRAVQALATEQQLLSKKISTQEEPLSKIPAQETATVNLQEKIQALDTKLGQVVASLQKSRLVGGLFKGL